MRNLVWIGVILIVLGIGGLLVQTVTYTETEEVVDLGPLELQSEEDHTIQIPTVVGIVAAIAGLGVIFVGKRRA